MNTRLYIVTQDSGEQSLVEAANPSQAIRHVVANRYSAKPASPMEVAKLVGDGVQVQKAGE